MSKKLVFIFAAFLLSSADPSSVFAQTDQKIVLSCTFPQGSRVVSLDLAAKTMSMTSTMRNPGGSPDPAINIDEGRITQVTEEQVVWTAGGEQDTLNRYTGSLMVQNQGGTGGPIPCQRQQKQF
jgi:hypothetical protein